MARTFQVRAGEVLLIGWPFLLPALLLAPVWWDVLFYGYSPLPFSKEAWAKASPDQRGYMLDDLLNNHAVEGQTQKEILGLLGAPDGGQFDNDDGRGSVWEYRIGYRGANPNWPMTFSYTLHVRFNRTGRVRDVYEDD